MIDYKYYMTIIDDNMFKLNFSTCEYTDYNSTKFSELCETYKNELNTENDLYNLFCIYRYRLSPLLKDKTINEIYTLLYNKFNTNSYLIGAYIRGAYSYIATREGTCIVPVNDSSIQICETSDLIGADLTQTSMSYIKHLSGSYCGDLTPIIALNTMKALEGKELIEDDYVLIDRFSKEVAKHYNMLNPKFGSSYNYTIMDENEVTSIENIKLRLCKEGLYGYDGDNVFKLPIEEISNIKFSDDILESEEQLIKDIIKSKGLDINYEHLIRDYLKKKILEITIQNVSIDNNGISLNGNKIEEDMVINTKSGGKIVFAKNQINF